MFRCRNTSSVPYVRAVVSPHFSQQKDDQQLLPPILQIISQENVQLEHFEWDDRFTILRADFLDCQTQSDDKTLGASLKILNSETGHSSVWIRPAIIINGYEYSSRSGEISHTAASGRFIHKGGIIEPEVINQIVQETKNLAQVGIVQYLKAQNETVEYDHALEFTKNLEMMPNRFTDILAAQWKRQEIIKKVQVMENIAEIIKDLPLFQKVTIQNQLGRFIHLFEDCADTTTEINRYI